MKKVKNLLSVAFLLAFFGILCLDAQSIELAPIDGGNGLHTLTKYGSGPGSIVDCSGSPKSCRVL